MTGHHRASHMSGPGVTPYGGHAGPVLSVACSPDGATFASGGQDATVRVWDAHTRQQLLQLHGHTGLVHAVAYATDGSTIASAGSDGTVRIWDPRTGIAQRQFALRGVVYSVAYSPDGAALAIAGDDGYRILQFSTGLNRLTSDRIGLVQSVAYAPDGAAFACGGNDGHLWIRDSGTGEERLRCPGHTDPILSIAYDPGGHTLATGDSGGAIRIWDLGTGEARRLTGHTKPVQAVAFSPDGSALASGDDEGDMCIWDVAAAEESYRPAGHTGTVWSVAWACDGSTVISAGNDGLIRVWSASSGAEQRQLTGHSGAVRSVAYSPMASTLATGGKDDGTVRIWDTRTGQQQAALNGHRRAVWSVAYDPNGSMLASSGDDCAVRIWNLRAGQAIRVITHARNDDRLDDRLIAYGPLAYSSDGTMLACGDDAGVVTIWDASTGDQRFRLAGLNGSVDAIAWSHDGKLASGGSDGIVRIWAPGTETAMRPLRGHATAILSLAYAPDGVTLASGGHDGAVRTWDTATGELRELTGHQGPVNAISWSPDGSTLASAGADRIALVQDARAGHVHFTLEGHTGSVKGITWSPDGATLATVGDMTIRIWNARNGSQVDGTMSAPLLRTPGRPLAGVKNDSPSEQDLLAATQDAEKLAELIAAATTSPPLAIALIGDWGVGKSSVMLQIENCVDTLAEMTLNNPGLSMFTGNVRQVRFNAWHYCDDRLWSGLVDHLFRTLAADNARPGVPHTPASPGTAAPTSAELGTQLAKLDVEKKQLSEALAAATNTGQPTGFLARIGSPVYVSRIVRTTCRELVNEVRNAPWTLLAWAALGGGAYAIWSLYGSLIGAAAVAVAVPIAPVAVAIQRLWSWHRKGMGAADRLRQRLEERLRTINQQMARLKENLALVDASTRLSAFLSDRASPQAYREFRGLLGQVRTDLEMLSSNLADARMEWEASRSAAAAPLERIVLYIDDLDRCPPQRVVEVLEAIHLMLALDLFVVVVAVDARWLIKSLERHHQEMFGAGKEPTAIVGDAAQGPDADSGPVSPVDYLDKIFQIPYVLVPPSRDAMASYLQCLLSPSAQVTGGPQKNTAIRSDPALRNSGVGVRNGGRSGAPDPAESVSERPDSSGNGGGREVDSHDLPTEEPGTRVRDLRPLRLQLSQPEIEFMARLGSVIPTPRAAKRLVNLYRLVRIGIGDPDIADFIGSDAGGPYQVVQILLAVLVASPATAPLIFREIASAPDEGNVMAILEGVGELTGSDFCKRIYAELSRIANEIPVLTTVTEFQRWCPILARYSFHTRMMAGGQWKSPIN